VKGLSAGAVLIAGAAMIVLFAIGAIVLGRWERSQDIDENRAGIARVRSEVGPKLVSRRLTGVVSDLGLACAQYRLQRSLGISLCWNGSGQLVEAARFDGDRTERWSLADRPSAATIRTPVRFLSALTRYATAKPKALALAAALRGNLRPCLRVSKLVLRRSVQGRFIIAAARRVVSRCSHAQAFIAAATKQAPQARQWLGNLPGRFRRLTASLVYAAGRLSWRLQHPHVVSESKRSALARYRKRRRIAIVRGAVLRAELKEAIAHQIERLHALER
jgi:hypothetical protein